MATLLYRLGRLAYRRWPLFLVAWVLALAAVGSVAATLAQPMSNSFSIPGIPAEEAADLQAELFPESGETVQANATVVVAAPAGHRLDEPRYRAQVRALVSALQGVPQLSQEAPPVNPLDAGAAPGMNAATAADGRKATRSDEAATKRDTAAVSPVSPDGRVGLISWNFDAATPADVKPATHEAVLDAIEDSRAGDLTVEVNGTGMQAQEAGGAAELLGIAVALVVLLVTFGSLVAAGLPVLTAVIGVMLGMTGITAMTAVTDIASSTTGLATMIGLAVGIDYALFILSRYRAELDDLGGDDRNPHVRAEAIGRAVGTAGSAVTFAGLTVLIALGALAVVRIPFLTAMGLGAAATVLIAVMISLTLLPAILGMLKSKAFAGRVRPLARRRKNADTGDPGQSSSGAPARTTLGVRWAGALSRRPGAVVAAGAVLLGALALPLTTLHLALPSDDTAPAETSRRKAADLIADAFGPGRQSPLLVVVDARDVPQFERDAAVADVVAWAQSHDNVVNAQVIATTADAGGAQVMITPGTGADDEATENLLEALRADEPQLEGDTGAVVGVTGLTALNTDVSARLAAALPTYLAVVMGLAFGLLMLVFRSLVVPLAATAGFLLSVLATLGATVAVFQNGAFDLMDGQPLVSFMPVFLIGVVFGLAMDYQVFLVTRIRESYVHGATAADAVMDGFRNSARVVSAAALIMMSVFSAFMLSDEPILKSMGFALAAAVFFDAFIVRMTLTPALLYLLGDKAWGLPRWLDRLLPEVDVEGATLPAHELAAARPESATAAAPETVATGQPASDEDDAVNADEAARRSALPSR